MDGHGGTNFGGRAGWDTVVCPSPSPSPSPLHARTLDESQNIEAAVDIPAPFFCMITHVTMYLNGLLSDCSSFKHESTIVLIWSFTFFWAYLKNVAAGW